MNDNELNNSTNKYTATSNLNTAIENPQINVDSATDINVQDLGYNNIVNSNTTANSEFINNQYSSDNSSITTGIQNNINSNTSINSNTNGNSELNTSTYSTTNSSEINTTTYSINNNINYKYEPTLEEKKADNENIISNLLHSKEFKALIFILLILCLFLLTMPYLYDFIRNIKLMR